ncbi:hypothetical protein V8G54_034683 [Vigna mungo]|uniref:Uncharacterized protein n=1 Tax=Vigna mungo TaxID=3915 RepID=A0AAQ3MDI8_VIGMU
MFQLPLMTCPNPCFPSFPQLKSHSYSYTTSNSHSHIFLLPLPPINPFTFFTLQNSSSSPFKPYLIFNFVLSLPAGLICTRACFLMGRSCVNFICDFSTFFTTSIYGFIFTLVKLSSLAPRQTQLTTPDLETFSQPLNFVSISLPSLFFPTRSNHPTKTPKYNRLLQPLP